MYFFLSITLYFFCRISLVPLSVANHEICNKCLRISIATPKMDENEKKLITQEQNRQVIIENANNSISLLR
jgi:hypothetical protein